MKREARRGGLAENARGERLEEREYVDRARRERLTERGSKREDLEERGP